MVKISHIAGFFLAFIIPLLIAVTVYRALSPSACFTTPTSAVQGFLNPPGIMEAQKQVSDYLVNTSKGIQSFAPLLQFNDEWFKYNVFFLNQLKVALAVSSPPSYTEATTTFSIQTLTTSSSIPYSEQELIARDVKSVELRGLITAFGLLTNSRPILVGPSEIVELQTSPNLGYVCINVVLQPKYFFLMYLEMWIVWMGFLILFRESLNLTRSGIAAYFLDD
jgi:hypothetical protein